MRDEERVEKLADLYIECHQGGLIKDNPSLCMRWLIGTCPCKRQCAETDSSMPCDHYTQRLDEAVLVVKKKG